IVVVRPQRVTGAYLSQDAPTEFVPMPESSQTPNVVPALDPRVDLETDVSFTPPPEEPVLDDEASAASPVSESSDVAVSPAEAEVLDDTQITETPAATATASPEVVGPPAAASTPAEGVGPA